MNKKFFKVNIFKQLTGKYLAFTLAEVLITVAIIGIVSILTVPTLYVNFQKKQFLISFMKRYSELKEVIKLSTIHHSENTNYWDYDLDDEIFYATYIAPFLKSSACSECWISYIPSGHWFEQPAFAAPPVQGDHSVEECFAECPTYDPNKWCLDDEFCYGITQACWEEGPESYTFTHYYPEKADACTAWLDAQNVASKLPEEPDVTYSLPNGATVGLVEGDASFYLYLDVNGKHEPNQYGRDRYIFSVVDNEVMPFGSGISDLTQGDYGCSASGNGMYCGAMIMQNNWDYPDNYLK